MILGTILELKTAPPEWFDRWWTPAEFAMAVNAHKETISASDFMCRSEAKPIREAWAAARYAIILSQDRPVSIQLEPDRFQISICEFATNSNHSKCVKRVGSDGGAPTNTAVRLNARRLDRLAE